MQLGQLLFGVDPDVEEPSAKSEIDSALEPEVAASGRSRQAPPHSSTGGTILIADDQDDGDRQAVRRGQTSQPITFAKVLEQARHGSAQRLFERATLDSKFRKLMVREGRHGNARTFALLKVYSACRAYEIAPDLVSIVQADDAPHLLSVRFRDRALHIPKSLLNSSLFDSAERN